MKYAYHLAFFYQKLTQISRYGVFLLMLALPLQGAAEMYKWVDGSGTVHYSQSPPPPGITGTTVKPPPAVDTEVARATLQSRLENLDKASQQREKQVSQSRQAELENTEQERLCLKARARLASYERPRISVPTAEGSQRRLDETERQQELERSLDLIDKLCK
jgi:hypothetical protein